MRYSVPVAAVVVLLVCSPPAYSGHPPLDLVRDATAQMLMALEKERDTVKDQPETMYALMEEIVLPHFDFESMGRWALGKYWRDAAPQQRKAFVEEFRALLVRTYSSALAEHAGEEIVYLPFNMNEGDTRAKVRTEIIRPNGMPVSIVYSLRGTQSGWKVYDVAIEGVSLVTNYRSTFASKIRAEGLDRLIQRLATNNDAAGPT